MKRVLVVGALAALATAPLAAGGRSVSGSYVEARTAEVFTGGCVMGSEAETTGREALLAWKVERGSFNGISLDGLSVVAAVVGDKNLGIFELGGERAASRSTVVVDERANAAQQMALVAMASELTNGVMGTIVNVSTAPIEFSEQNDVVRVSTGLIALGVNKHMTHDPSCGNQQWFHPLAAVDEATLGHTEQNSYLGSGLGSKWSDPNKRSSFFGTFSR
jgi:hypothetical protein